MLKACRVYGFWCGAFGLITGAERKTEEWIPKVVRALSLPSVPVFPPPVCTGQSMVKKTQMWVLGPKLALLGF